MRTVLAAWLGLALITPASAETFIAGIGATPCTVLLANAREVMVGLRMDTRLV